MKSTVATLLATTAILGVRAAPTHRDIPLSYTYGTERILDGQGRVCDEWLISGKSSREVVQPDCAKWTADNNHTEDYTVVPARLKNGRCSSWSAIVENGYVSPRCDAVAPIRAERDLAKDEDEKKGRPLSMTPHLSFSPASDLEGQGRRCDEWVIKQNPLFSTPACAKWIADNGHTEDYHVTSAIVRPATAKCLSWSAVVENGYVSPRCDDFYQKSNQARDEAKDKPRVKYPTVTFVDTDTIDAQGRTCEEWNVTVDEQNVAEPQCAEWVSDNSHTTDYNVVMVAINKGTCLQWKVTNDSNRIIPECLQGAAPVQLQRDLAKDKPKEKRPTVTYVDTDVLDGQGRSCKEWSIISNEQNVAEPQCDEWVADNEHVNDYNVVMATINHGKCIDWNAVIENDRVVPECREGAKHEERDAAERLARTHEWFLAHACFAAHAPEVCGTLGREDIEDELNGKREELELLKQVQAEDEDIEKRQIRAFRGPNVNGISSTPRPVNAEQRKALIAELKQNVKTLEKQLSEAKGQLQALQQIQSINGQSSGPRTQSVEPSATNEAAPTGTQEVTATTTLATKTKQPKSTTAFATSTETASPTEIASASGSEDQSATPDATATKSQAPDANDSSDAETTQTAGEPKQSKVSSFPAEPTSAQTGFPAAPKLTQTGFPKQPNSTPWFPSWPPQGPVV